MNLSSEPRNEPKRVRRAAALAAAAGLALLVAPAASASHSFSDVPDAHPFHAEIGIFKQTNITTGCTATEFCAEDYVRRQAMAAFVDRALGLIVRPGETTQRAIPGSRVEQIDDDVSFVGTSDGALELSHNGARGLRLEGNASSPNVIGGSPANAAEPGTVGATIGGGGWSGTGNHVYGNYGTVSGGTQNSAGSPSGLSPNATVGGGSTNSATMGNSTVAGGSQNQATGLGSTVGGGGSNVASGTAATVPGGALNTAVGGWSLAAGYRAKANHNGSFVWGDNASADVSSPTANSFSVRASGGIWLGTNSSPSIPAGRFLNTSTGAYLSSTGTWTNNSDRKKKTDVRPLDKQALLERLARLPVTSWAYKSDPRTRHVGPMAQDFARAFGIGLDPEHIATVDADGVALAAIQQLHRDNRALRRENRALAARLAEVERAVAGLSGR